MAKLQTGADRINHLTLRETLGLALGVTRVRSHFTFFTRHSVQEDPPALGRQIRPGNSQPKMTQRSNTNDLPFTMQCPQLLVSLSPGDSTRTHFLVHSMASCHNLSASACTLAALAEQHMSSTCSHLIQHSHKACAAAQSLQYSFIALSYSTVVT